MNIETGIHNSLSTAGVYTDMSGLAQLRTEASKRTPEANKEVAQQFEALFLQSMLKAMRQANTFDESAESDQTRFYQDLFDKQIALDLSAGEGIGLAIMLQRQMDLDDSHASDVDTSLDNGKSWVPESKKDFVAALWPHAQQAADKLGVSPELLIAQSALETGWGKQVIAGPNGRSSHNLFGIKADTSWSGASVKVSTLEYRDDVARREQAMFRSYESFDASLQDYVNFLEHNPRYLRAVENASDPNGFLNELQQAGYATDPAYAEKISSILNNAEFSGIVSQMKNNGSS